MKLRSGRLRSLRAVWLPFGSNVGAAACIDRVRAGQRIRIATVARDGAGVESDASGDIEKVHGDTFLVRLAHVGKRPQPGDPVFVESSHDPRWRVLGVVDLALLSRVRVISLRAIFSGFPTEGSWALQAPGLCDPAEETSAAGRNASLERLLLPAVKEMFARNPASDTDAADLFASMQRHW